MNNTKLNLQAAISTIMTTELTTVREETLYAALKDLFKRRSMHHILVENKEMELLGIISTEDLAKSKHFLALEDKLEARHIMTPRPVSVEPATPIRKVIELFIDNRFRAIPVMNDENILVGIVTPFDILYELVEG